MTPFHQKNKKKPTKPNKQQNSVLYSLCYYAIQGQIKMFSGIKKEAALQFLELSTYQAGSNYTHSQ